MLDDELKATHVYKNLKTKREWPFYFAPTNLKGLWNCVTLEDEIIGEWDSSSRAFRMKNGLSLHVIVKIEKEEI